jgi:hypothetical protein
MSARVARVLELYHPHPFTFGGSWVRVLMLAAWYGLIPIAIAGAVVLRRRRTTLLPLVAAIVAATANVALTWGSLRFRVPIDVAVVVLAAVGVDAAMPSSRRRRRPDTRTTTGRPAVDDAVAPA